MIHIDLGISFDQVCRQRHCDAIHSLNDKQGKYLPIPELVPFRLTADIVDGMGISGTEGVFRKCSEQTLRVLREGSDIIKTVLEVFKYDPLYIWYLVQLFHIPLLTLNVSKGLQLLANYVEFRMVTWRMLP